MFTKRIIPCLDVHNGRVVKGVNFVDLKDDLSKQTPVYSNNKPANDIGEKNVITSEVDENISSNLRDYQLK